MIGILDIQLFRALLTEYSFTFLTNVPWLSALIIKYTAPLLPRISQSFTPSMDIDSTSEQAVSRAFNRARTQLFDSLLRRTALLPVTEIRH